MSRRLSIIGGSKASYTNTLSTYYNGINQVTNNGLYGPGITPFPLLYFQRDDDFTINLWIKIGTGAEGYVLYAGNSTDAYYLQVLNNNRVRWQFLNVTSGGTFQRIDSTTTISNNTWTKITATYSGSTGGVFQLYFNDSLQPSVSSGSFPAITTVTYSAFQLGAQLIGPTYRRFIECYIDEVTIWDKVLSSAEIAQVQTSTDPQGLSFAGNLIEHWRMGDGDTYPTITGHVNGYDLSMLNMTSGNFVNDVP